MEDESARKIGELDWRDIISITMLIVALAILCGAPIVLAPIQWPELVAAALLSMIVAGISIALTRRRSVLILGAALILCSVGVIAFFFMPL